MRKIILGIITFNLLLGAAILQSSDAPDKYYLRVFPPDYKAALREFGTVRNYDVAGVNKHESWIDVIVSESEYFKLVEEFPLQVLTAPGESQEKLDPQYKTPDEINTLIHSFAAAHPNITNLISIGTTLQNRDIWAIKISDNPAVDEDEPACLLNGMHHAREVMTPEICLDAIEYLCTRYATDPQVAAWVNNLEIWIIPMVNVDGNNYVWTNDTMWRKDRHTPPSGSCYGIDPNRNYDAFFASCGGSSSYSCDDDYHGQFAEQSTCVARMAVFGETIRPVFDISLHSYSELVIYPYGCDGEYTPEHDIIAGIGSQMASLIERDSGGMGYSPGTSWQLLYATDGGDIDWWYSELGTIPFVIEVNADDFQPSYNTWRDSTCERLRPAWQYMLNRIDGPGVTGLITNACTGEPVSAVVNIQELPLTGDETPRNTDSFGRYFRVLTPGDYHLQVTAIGFPSATIPVTVGQTRLDRDIELVPAGAFGLYFASLEILDSAGDGDGTLDPGESAFLKVSLTSSGATTNVSAVLSTSDMYVGIPDASAEFGNIGSGMTGSSQMPHFAVQIDPQTPEQHVITFNLTIDADQSLCVTESEFSTVVSSYVYECPVYYHNMDINPGYTIQNTGSGGWAYGDPTSGPGNPHSGTNCFATNLSGEYGNNGNFRLVSTPFDCSQISNAQLIFWRWLQNEAGYDTASVDVSTDSTNWTNVWSGYAQDSAWTEMTYDISSIADGQPQVYIRWRLISDGYLTYLGFYLDDVSICGNTLPSQTATPAPTWTSGPSTPTRTPTQPPQPTFTRTPAPTGTTYPPTNTPIQTFTPENTRTPSPTMTPTPTAIPGEPTNTAAPTWTPAPFTPTETPASTVPPTQTPVNGFHAQIVLNDSMFEANALFLLELDIRNNLPESVMVDEYLVLEAAGSFFFAPGWTTDPDHIIRAFPAEYQTKEEVFRFNWPAVEGSMDGLAFYLGYLDSTSKDLMCDISMASFGYR